MGKKRCIDSNRGQISIFFILGILFVILIVYAILVTDMASPETATYHRRNLEMQFDKEALDTYIDYCIVNQSGEILKEIGLNGGVFNQTDVELHSRRYEGTSYRTICVNVEGAKYCVNRIISLSDIEQEIEQALLKVLDGCIDMGYLKGKGYGVALGEKDMNVDIGANMISFSLNYPITLSNKELEVKVTDFYVTMDHEFGLIYRLVLDILNHETTDGYFDKDEWMNDNNMLFSINKYKPYPYVLYSIEGDDGYLFNFGLEMEDTASRVGRNFVYDLEYGCCYIEQNCFKNVDEYSCRMRNGSYEHYGLCECTDHFAGDVSVQPDLLSCSGYDDGESWCENTLGVGGRGIKKSCHNGTIYIEECKDFKEEVCVDYTESGGSRAVCKPNRWEDCTRCNSKDCCENELLRDCLWKDKNYSVISESDTIQCVPKVGPGFRFWDGAGQEVCNLGTKYATCSGYYCDEEWVDFSSTFCSQLGDCGINWNFLGVLTTSGYMETDPRYDEQVIELTPPFLTKNREQEHLVFTEERESFNLIPSLISAGLNYLDDVSHRRTRILDYSFCGLWQPSLSNNQCHLCDIKGVCSEYKCYSLGDDCIYSEDDGYPNCERKSGGSQDINIYFTSNYSYNKGSIVLSGNTLVGFDIEEPIPAYELLNFGITTSVPTKCKITYMPDLTFTETPAIWFGKPEFSMYHNVSFRLPEDITVPEKLYENLNISSIEELFNLIVENDEELRDVFEDDFADVLEGFSEFMASKDYLVSLLRLTMSGIDDNTYYTFIRCSDDSGNENEEPVYLSFTITNEYEDTEPPRLLYSIPENNSKLNIDPYELSIYVDEPAECKYSSRDEGYGVMPNDFDCETSKLKLSSVAGGSYECTTTTSILKPFIRCMDNPPDVREYIFRVTNEISEDTGNYARNGTSVVLTESNLFNNTAVHLSHSGTIYPFSIILPKFNSCRVGFNGFDYGMMQDLICNEINESSPYYAYGSNNCSRGFISGDYYAYIQCIGEVPSERNMNVNSHILNFTLDGDLSIVSLFPSYDELMSTSNVPLGVVVNRNLNDHDVNCGYSMGNNGEVYQMYSYGNYQFKRNLYGVLSGGYDVLFRCIDSSGSIAEASTRFVVE